MMRSRRRLTLSLSALTLSALTLPALMLPALMLVGCGASAPPRPNTLPPRTPQIKQALRVGTGFEVHVDAPKEDRAGRTLPSVEVRIFINNKKCEGTPAATGIAGQPIRIVIPHPAPVQLTATSVHGTHSSTCSESVSTVWSAPPAALTPPVAFAEDGVIQLTWLLPSTRGLRSLRLYRNEALIAEQPITNVLYTDHPAPGRHRYRIVGVGDDFLTPRSGAAWVLLPRKRK